jgi:hypothetical protein
VTQLDYSKENPYTPDGHATSKLPEFEIARKLFNDSGGEARCKFLRRFSVGGSDVFDRAARAVPVKCIGEPLNSARGRRLLADQGVTHIEEEPTNISQRLRLKSRPRDGGAPHRQTVRGWTRWIDEDLDSDSDHLGLTA